MTRERGAEQAEGAALGPVANVSGSGDAPMAEGSLPQAGAPDDLAAWRAALSALTVQIEAASERKRGAGTSDRQSVNSATPKLAPAPIEEPKGQGNDADASMGDPAAPPTLTDSSLACAPEPAGPTDADAARAFMQAQAQFRQRQAQEADAREAFRNAYIATAKQPRPPRRFLGAIASRLGVPTRSQIVQASGVFRADDRFAARNAPEAHGEHPLFDRGYYLSHNPDVARGKADPFLHYLRFGDAEGRDPSALFRVQWYREKAGAALDRWGATTLSHYVQLGAAGGLSAHPLFDPLYYASQCPPGLLAGREPMSHYLREGWRLGLDPHPLFSTRFYSASNPDVVAQGVAPWRHYVTGGWRELRQPHPLFDAAFYLQSWPEVAAEGVEPLEHFVTTGWKEGRDPHPEFCLGRYLEHNADVAASGQNPLIHYCESGGWEGRPLGSDFDPGAYLALRPSNLTSRLPPLALWIWDGRPTDRLPMAAHLPPAPVVAAAPVIVSPDPKEELEARALKEAFRRIRRAHSFQIEPEDAAARAKALRRRLRDERRNRLEHLASRQGSAGTWTRAEAEAIRGSLGFPVVSAPTVSIVVVGGALPSLAQTLDGLAGQITAKPWEVLIADTERELGLAPWCQTHKGLRVAVSNTDGPIAAVDAAIRQARAEVIVVLGEGVSLGAGDIDALSRLSEHVGQAQWATPMIVGGDGRILEAGCGLDRQGTLRALAEGEDPALPFTQENRRVSALSGRCFACRSDDWQALYDLVSARLPVPSFAALSQTLIEEGGEIHYAGRARVWAVETAPLMPSAGRSQAVDAAPVVVAATFSLSGRVEGPKGTGAGCAIPNVSGVRFPRSPAAPKADEAAVAPFDLAVKRAQSCGIDAFVLDADDLFAAPDAAVKALNRLDKLGQGYLLRLSLIDPRLTEQAQLLQRALAGRRAVRFGDRPLLIVADVDCLDKPRRGLRALRRALQALEIPNPWCIAEDTTGGSCGLEDAAVFGAEAWTAPVRRLFHDLPPSRAKVLNPEFAGEAFDYADAIAATVAAWPRQHQCIPWVFASHDTTLVEGAAATIVTDAHPASFQVFLEAALQCSQQAWPPHHRLVLVSSFNDWNCGSAIEPDEPYGEAWLEAVAVALERTGCAP